MNGSRPSEETRCRGRWIRTSSECDGCVYTVCLLENEELRLQRRHIIDFEPTAPGGWLCGGCGFGGIGYGIDVAVAVDSGLGIAFSATTAELCGVFGVRLVVGIGIGVSSSGLGIAFSVTRDGLYSGLGVRLTVGVGI